MRKLKIYLDTSVISYLKQDDAPDKMNDTLILWEEIKQGLYDVYISDVTLKEIAKCQQPKQDIMLGYLMEIDYSLIEGNKEIGIVAQEFINNKILSVKSYDDCRLIACAIVNQCDWIISWNFKHMVNYRTAHGIKLVSAITGYRDVDICSPTFMIGGEDSE